MPYKPSLMNKLAADYEDSAEKYAETRNDDLELSEKYLHRMKLLAKNMCYVQRMMDGTLGREAKHSPLTASHITAPKV